MAAPSMRPAEQGKPAQEPGSIASQIDGRLGEARREGLKKLLWLDRFTSLWAPVSIFGLVFLVYLLVVELHTPSEAWARPLLKGFGTLMLVAFFGLWASRYVLRRFSELRQLRTSSRELEEEVLEIARARGASLEPKLRGAVVDRTVALREAMLGREPQALDAELQVYGEFVEKSLSAHRRNGTFYFASGLLKAFAIALLIRTVFLEPFKIPSGSMIPTLAIGDQIFVNKFIYGVRIPFLNVVPFVIVRQPRHGDVIVFENPLDGSKDFIKRVIGLPGDRVRLEDEVVFINGAPQPRELLDESFSYDYRNEEGPWHERTSMLYVERLGDRSHSILQERAHNFYDDVPEFTVPPDSVFVMGDNREASADGRLSFGVEGLPPRVVFVPYGHIKGKAMVIWLSLSRDGLFSGLFGGTGIRTDRFFLPVR